MQVAERASRHELGGLMSTVCFRAVILGVEEALGEKAAAIAFISAGRQRGRNLAEELGLVNKGSEFSLQEATEKIAHALGYNGTRLCCVDKIEALSEGFRVYTRETICSYGEVEGSARKCTYTLGAIQGFLESFFNQRLRGQQVGSVLRGDQHDIFEFHARSI
jgi:predicted hydrocarbon binding protein